MAFFDNSHRLQRSLYGQGNQPNYNNYSSMYNRSNVRPQSHFSQYQNPYYTAKQIDDHRFDRTLLQKPAFLIKDQFLYPNNFSVNDRLDYADRLIQDTKSKHYYREDAQQFRMRKMGESPFDRSIEEIGQKIKRRVRMDTFNPIKSKQDDDLDAQILKFRNNLHRQNSQKTKPIARSVYVLGLKPKEEDRKNRQKYQKQQQDRNKNQQKKANTKYSSLNQQQQFDNPFQRDQDHDSDFASRKPNGHFSPIPQEEHSEYLGQKLGSNILSYANQYSKNNNNRNSGQNYKPTKSKMLAQSPEYRQGKHPQQILHKGKIFKRIL